MIKNRRGGGSPCTGGGGSRSASTQPENQVLRGEGMGIRSKNPTNGKNSNSFYLKGVKVGYHE